MVRQNSHRQQLLVQEIHMQEISGAQTDQNSSHTGGIEVMQINLRVVFFFRIEFVKEEVKK